MLRKDSIKLRTTLKYWNQMTDTIPKRHEIWELLFCRLWGRIFTDVWRKAIAAIFLPWRWVPQLQIFQMILCIIICAVTSQITIIFSHCTEKPVLLLRNLADLHMGHSIW